MASQRQEQQLSAGPKIGWTLLLIVVGALGLSLLQDAFGRGYHQAVWTAAIVTAMICIWAREQGNWFWRRKTYDAGFRLLDVHLKPVKKRTAYAKRVDRVIAVSRKVHLDELRDADFPIRYRSEERRRRVPPQDAGLRFRDLAPGAPSLEQHPKRTTKRDRRAQ